MIQQIGQTLLALFLCLPLFFKATDVQAGADLLVSEEPYASGSILAGKYQPLINYLQQQGFSARYLRTENYGQYVARAHEQKLDIAFASSGLANLLMTHYGYQPVLASDSTLNAVVIVPSQSPVQDLQALAGKPILAPEPYDIVHELAKRLLDSRFTDPASRPQIVVNAKVDRIILSVMSGEYPAGIVAGYDLSLVAPDLRNRIRIVAQSENVNQHFILLRKDFPPAPREALVEKLTAFHGSAEGKTYAEDFGSSRFVPVTDIHREELKSFSTFSDFINHAP